MTEPGTTKTQRSAWGQQQITASYKMRAVLEELSRRYEMESLASTFGPSSGHPLRLSFATGTYSKHWQTISLSWGALLKFLDAGIPTNNKDCIILCPGPLKGGSSSEGTRKLKDNVESLHLLIYDFDKGDATIEALTERLEALGTECAMYPTFSHLKDTSKLSWSVTRPNTTTGESETLPSAFQSFAKDRLKIDRKDALDPSRVTGEIARAFMVEQQGFDDDVLGEVSVLDTKQIETEQARGADNRRHTVSTTYFVVRHKPLSKTRLVILLSEPVVRRADETPGAFQARWRNEIYDPVGYLIGFKFDPQCASTERGHYARMFKTGAEKIPLRHIVGQPLDLTALETEQLLAPYRTTRFEQSGKKKQDRGQSTSEARSAKQPDSSSRNWKGFQAADAAADLLPSVTDKRTDHANSLVAFPCPFVHLHATSNNPTAHQCYAYNASQCDWHPTVKCQSATCEGRPSSEFLDALFPPEVQNDPRYRIPCVAQMTGCFITGDEIEDKLREINETWAVVRGGGRTRFLHETESGELEFYDSKSVDTWFANWQYLEKSEGGKPKLKPFFPLWNSWEHRRQYNGIRFCPNPKDVPPGIYNTYRGFTVEPKKGSWKLLLGHIYRNICQGNPEYFRFFIAWLAQLVQEPHIKPGTNIVLRGKEGVGKSKIGEWIVELFGIHAIVVAEAERITGRFNAHLENKLFMMAEEAFWAGDKAAEGKLKDLATGKNTSYERKGLDPYEGQNYTRIMIASNEDWVVPASSGGRRWFVLEVGDERQQDHAYFAAIDEEMNNGGLEAMLYDLLQTNLPDQVNVRSAPVTKWLVEQRNYSYDNKMRWMRGVLLEGGFRNDVAGNFVKLDESHPTAVNREDYFISARRHFAGPKGVDPTPSEIGQFLSKIFGKLQTSRPRGDGVRHRCTIFPPLKEMRERWLELTGEDLPTISDVVSNDKSVRDLEAEDDWPVVEAETYPLGRPLEIDGTHFTGSSAANEEVQHDRQRPVCRVLPTKH